MKDEFVQEQLGEVARLFYSNDSVTINLYAAAAAAVLFTLLLIPLLALLFQPSGGAAVATGYGAPSVGYGAPEESYGAPAQGYGAPSYSRSDDVYGEARSFYNDVIDSGDESSNLVHDITKKLGQVGPVMSALGNAAANLLE